MSISQLTTKISPYPGPYSEADVGKTTLATVKFQDLECTFQLMEGCSDSVKDMAEDVAALAKRPIALPIPWDTQSFEARKVELIGLAQSDLDREMITKVTSAVLHITFPMLAQQIQACVAQFNKRIGSSDYHAIVVPQKSNEWVTQLALKYGIVPPKSLLSFESSNNCEITLGTSDLIHLLKDKETVVVMDDCSFSGGQMIGFITLLTKIEAAYGISFDRKTNMAVEEVRMVGSQTGVKTALKTIYFLIPFLSSLAKTKIEAWTSFLKQRLDIDIVCITGSAPIPMAHDILSEEEQERFIELFNPASQGNFYSDSLSFSDWRVPDWASIPQRVFGGEINYPTPVETIHSLNPNYVFRPYFDSYRGDIQNT